MAGRLTRDSGAINYVTIFLVLVVVGGGYLAWVVGPLYLQYFGMRKAVKVACNQAYRDRSDRTVRDVILREWKELNMRDGSLDDGVITMVPTPFDRDENIEVTFTAKPDPETVTVAIHYTNHVVFPFINKEKDFDFEYSHTEDLSPIKY